MSEFFIVLGNKNYSSWSLRGWLVLAACGVDFGEEVIPLDRPETKARLRAASPTARVPSLRHGALTIPDSLAIAEYLAERFPGAGLWPEDPAARAKARAAVCEMHSGFTVLRAELPMAIRESFPGRSFSAAAKADIARVIEIWETCRAAPEAAGGPFLFSRFGIADAFYAPVVTRFRTYGIALPAAAEAYAEAVLAWPDLKRWSAAAAEEPWTLENP
ncbi:MAG: glutathione S-transferase family protein [Rhodovibrionaceae bacterium]